MFIVTNREVFADRHNLAAFGSKPNPKGPNELRLADARKTGGRWTIDILPDHIDPQQAHQEGLPVRFHDDNGAPVFVASQLVARTLQKRLNRRKRHLVLFVHGFNNNLKDVLDRALGFEQNFGVEVVAFSWPADGGGLGGVASYLSDKRDAQASVGALSRVIGRIAEYLDEFNAQLVADVEAEADADPDLSADGDAWDAHFTDRVRTSCPYRISLVMHSMGNYLFKHVQTSSATRIDRLVFDNVILAAADTNNQDHPDWVDTIQCRNRVFITINEDDKALLASRLKAGEQQKARLGHFPYNLHSERAVYVNFTSAAHVGDSHAYFEGTPLKNDRIKKFFTRAFNGERAEEDLKYDEARNLYFFPR